jgi:tetratricopeptide (TPR) repeat protein
MKSKLFPKISFGRKLFFLSTIFICLNALAQNKIIDSLKIRLTQQLVDTDRVWTTSLIFKQYSKTGHLDSADVYLEKNKRFIDSKLSGGGGKLNLFYKNQLAAYWNNKANLCFYRSDYSSAKSFLVKSIELRKETGDEKGLSAAYNNIGAMEEKLGNYASALEYQKKALSIREKLKDWKGLASTNNNLGNILSATGKFPEAQKFYLKSLEMYEKTGDSSGIAYAMSNIGVMLKELNNYKEAIAYFERAVIIREKINDVNALGDSYNGLGDLYRIQKNYDRAFEYFDKTIKISANASVEQFSYALAGKAELFAANGKFNEAISNYENALKLNLKICRQEFVAGNYMQIGSLQLKTKEFSKAITNFQKGLELSEIIGHKNLKQQCYEGLSIAYEGSGNYKEALKNYSAFIALRDSLVNEENTKKMVQAEMQYTFDKKEAAQKLAQEKKDALAAEQLKQEKQQRNYFIAGFILVLLISAFILRSFLQKKKANKMLEEKNKLIEHQKELVEEKQKEILDSIYYARRIQRTLITSEKYIAKNLRRLNNKTRTGAADSA